MNTVFLDRPEGFDADTDSIAIIPVPYDKTSSWVKGADKGPAAIIDASGYVEWYDIQTRSQIHERGIATRDAIECDDGPEALAELVQSAVRREFEAGVFPVLLGGEHSISIGAIRAAAERHDDVTILQIDAHADTREDYHGSKCNHACVMARAREVAPIVQVGIRSIAPEEAATIDESRVVFAHEILRAQNDAWIERTLLKLSKKVYVTIDLDAFDPSVVPATGTPEPGGLSWLHVDKLLTAVAEKADVVGFDVVELCPAPGHHASAFTAAKLVTRFLSEIFSRRH
ncbi:MAG: agmatinase [Phycisphaeraceae bacterium]|nr:MAG: agmatinase [Phycisphaeraceae bacterium]